MNGFTLAPALGWFGVALAVAMLAVAAAVVAVHVRRRGSSDETTASCVRRALMCAAVALMLLTPSVVTSTTSRAVNATDVVVAVDVTGSMAVADAHYGSDETIRRLDAAKAAVRDVTALYPDASFMALRFGATGTVDVPLTPDTHAIGTWADTLTPEATSVSGGSSLDAPLDRLLLSLKELREERPDDAIVLYLITDGEQTATGERRSFSTLRRYLDDGFVVGVGSTEGGRIPVIRDGGASSGETSDGSDGSSDVGAQADADGWVIDPDTGEPGVSRMDETTLTAIADEVSGTYLHVDASTTMADGRSAEASRRWQVTSTAKRRERTSPVVWPLAVIVLVLASWEAGAWIVMSRRLL